MAIHGVSRHSFTQEALWRKGPSDHLPLVSTTMSRTLLKCAEGGRTFVLTELGEGRVRLQAGVLESPLLTNLVISAISGVERGNH